MDEDVRRLGAGVSDPGVEHIHGQHQLLRVAHHDVSTNEPHQLFNDCGVFVIGRTTPVASGSTFASVTLLAWFSGHGDRTFPSVLAPA
jgi:hypothetical protein